MQFAFSVCFIAAGGSRPAPSYYADRDHYVAALKYSHIDQIPYVATVCLTKISVCLMVLRIKSTKRLRWSMCLLILGRLVVNIADIVVLLAQCRPIELLFDDSRTGTCWPTTVIAVFTTTQGSPFSLSQETLDLCPKCALFSILCIDRFRLYHAPNRPDLGFKSPKLTKVRYMRTDESWTDVSTTNLLVFWKNCKS